MRALMLADWWRIEVRDLPAPRPAPGEVLIDVLATGICGSDVHGFTGDNGRRRAGQVMGHETVGRITAFGADVPADSGLRVGGIATVNPVLACGSCTSCRGGREQACPAKRVIGVDPAIRSAFAQQLVVASDNVVPLPDTMPIAYGALVEPLAVGYHALRLGGCTAGDAVLVIGGGPVGQACVLAARRLGARAVAVSEPDAHRQALNRDIGAGVVEPGAGNLAVAVQEVLDGPPDLVVDAVGVNATLTDAFACSPPGSTVVLVGMGAPNLDLAAYQISTQERSLVGSFCYSAEEFRDTAAWVGTAPPELGRLIEQCVDLDSGPDSFTALARGESKASKILVLPNGSLA